MKRYLIFLLFAFMVIGIQAQVIDLPGDVQASDVLVAITPAALLRLKKKKGKLADEARSIIEGVKDDEGLSELNPNSKETFTDALLEPALAEECHAPEKHFQLQRKGYFVTDRHLTAKGKIVLNMTVGLKESGFTKAVKGS